MKLRENIVEFSIRHPKTIFVLVFLVVAALGAQIPRITIDTDPENMLPPDQAARVFHNLVKEDFDLPDLIVVGVVNEEDPEGVFNPGSLSRIHELTRAITIRCMRESTNYRPVSSRLSTALRLLARYVVQGGKALIIRQCLSTSRDSTQFRATFDDKWRVTCRG